MTLSAFHPRRMARWIQSVSIGIIPVTVGVVFFLIVFDNQSFFKAVLKAMGRFTPVDAAFMASLVVSLAAAMTFILSLVAFKYLFKPVVTLLLVTAAFAAYFMDAYGIMIDKSMMVNIMQTDSGEVGELINLGMFYHATLFGILPSLVLWKIKIAYRPFFREMLSKLGILLICLAILGVNAAFFYKDYASIFRNNRYLRYLINPVNYIYATQSYVKHQFDSGIKIILPIGEDAVAAVGPAGGKKTVTILVLGETARAANFSLDGYERDTNPLLSKEDIINFSHFYSSGTSTAESLPRMFSHQTRDTFSDDKNYENVLDVLSHAGMSVLWRENNSGCKGLCQRVDFEDLRDSTVSGLCRPDECYDEILLHNLKDYIDKADNDIFIVLHQKGSHGPTYDLRYPDAFRKFTPVCSKGRMEDCTRQEIINSYDNTILYTDYFLSRVIGFLQDISGQYNTAMLYASDHGESLGENNVYLHGLPYWMAPDEQTHVPFILWFSKGFTDRFKIDIPRLRAESDQTYSHDALFSSILGMLDIKTSVYDKSLDIFAGCKN